VCSGPSEWAGVEAVEAVALCGPTEEQCSQSWAAELSGEELWEVTLKWTGALTRALETVDWIVTPTPRPQTWTIILRNARKAAWVEVEEGRIQITIEPRAECPSGDALIAALEPFLSPLAGIDIDTEWPVIAEVVLKRDIDEEILASVRERLGRPHDSRDLAQRTLLGSEPFACFGHRYRRTGTMKAVRRAFGSWYKAISPDALELRVAARLEELARQRDTREVDVIDAESLPEEVEP